MTRFLSLSFAVVLGAMAIGCAAEAIPDGVDRTPRGDTSTKPEKSAGTSATGAYSETVNAAPKDETPARSEPNVNMGAQTTNLPPIACATNVDSVTTSYNIALLRAPDSAGLSFWVLEIQAGKERIGVLRDLVHSEEFVTARAGLDDTRFIRSLYAGVLAREPDPDGLNFWLGELESGMTRSAVAQSFIDSDEFKDPTLNRAFACYF